MLAMATSDLQSLCALGQQQLMSMDYLAAEATLVLAEQVAFERGDFDTLSRLYMPLQEARRQRRQRCGEGMICLDLISKSADDEPNPQDIVETYPHGQLLVAGWGSIEPAERVRALQVQRHMYAETFLGAVYPVEAGHAVVIVPLAGVQLPPPAPMAIDALIRTLPPHSIVLNRTELPAGPRRGTAETYAYTMSMWERLHTPFLAAADMLADGMQKIEAYRKAIRVDYACELAHQKLADVARLIPRTGAAVKVRT
jgi:hypothetical protein